MKINFTRSDRNRSMLQRTISGDLFSRASMVLLGLVACLVTGMCRSQCGRERSEGEHHRQKRPRRLASLMPMATRESSRPEVEDQSQSVGGTGSYGYAAATTSKQHNSTARYNFTRPSMIVIRKTMRSLWRGSLKPTTFNFPSFRAADKYQYDVENHELMIVEGKK